MPQTKILFLCHGNICRSPMAEFVMRYLAEQAGIADRFLIDSAAVSSEEIGNDIYPPAKRKLREKGIPFSAHAARRVTPDDYAFYDYLVCADRSNLRWLERIVGPDTDHKVSLLMAWPQLANEQSKILNLKFEILNLQSSFPSGRAGVGSVPDVFDPWYSGDFETAYRDILTACSAMLKLLA